MKLTVPYHDSVDNFIIINFQFAIIFVITFTGLDLLQCPQMTPFFN